MLSEGICREREGDVARSKKDQELFDMLRARGLRKKVANTIASATGKQSKRSEAAAKAARTRKRQAAKRSAAAKKGARTRTKSGR